MRHHLPGGTPGQRRPGAVQRDPACAGILPGTCILRIRNGVRHAGDSLPDPSSGPLTAGPQRCTCQTLHCMSTHAFPIPSAMGSAQTQSLSDLPVPALRRPSPSPLTPKDCMTAQDAAESDMRIQQGKREPVHALDKSDGVLVVSQATRTKNGPYVTSLRRMSSDWGRGGRKSAKAEKRSHRQTKGEADGGALLPLAREPHIALRAFARATAARISPCRVRLAHSVTLAREKRQTGTGSTCRKDRCEEGRGIPCPIAIVVFRA
jgi:hypothetical protein